MPDYCAVPLCKGFGGFRFPKDPILLKKWQVAIRRQTSGKKLWKPKNSSVVCAKHFQESDFYKPKVLYGEKRRRLLKKEAIPSIFPFSTTNQSESAAARTGVNFINILLAPFSLNSDLGSFSLVTYKNLAL